METTIENIQKTLKQIIDADMKSAMLSKDNRKRDILRFIKSEISREEGGIKAFKDEDVIRLIRKIIKNLEIVGTEDAKEEIKILEQYIPKQLSESEIEINVKSLIVEMGGGLTLKEMGKVIAAFNNKYTGMADGKTVANTVKSILSKC